MSSYFVLNVKVGVTPKPGEHFPYPIRLEDGVKSFIKVNKMRRKDATVFRWILPGTCSKFACFTRFKVELESSIFLNWHCGLQHLSISLPENIEVTSSSL